MVQTIVAIILVIGAAIGALVLWPLAKGVGKISHANFKNSFVVCFISSLVYGALIYAVGKQIFGAGLVVGMIINIVFLLAIYMAVGKFIWKCSWVESFKANIVWILIYCLILVWIYNKFPQIKMMIE